MIEVRRVEVKLYEYNVTPNVNERKEYSVLLVNDTLTINGNTIDDKDKVFAIQEVLERNKQNIIMLSNEETENYKGGRQKCLIVKFETNGEIYRIIGNTPKNEMADFYIKITIKIL